MCPASGKIVRLADGTASAMRRAARTGVRRSRDPTSTAVGMSANAASAASRSWASRVGWNPDTVSGRQPPTVSHVIRMASGLGRAPSSSHRIAGAMRRGSPSCSRRDHSLVAAIRRCALRYTAAAGGDRPNGRSASPPLAVATSTTPTARASTCGWRSASAIRVMPPIECPASTSGPVGAVAATTSARSSASWSIVIVAGSTGAERPWPRWSGRTTRTGEAPVASDLVTGLQTRRSSVQPWTRTAVTGASCGPSSSTCSGTPSAAGTDRAVVM